MKKRHHDILILALVSSALWPSVAHANVVWPALFLGQKLMTPFPILFGLIVEYLAIRSITGFPIGKSILVTFVMNLVSSVVGIVAVPLVGMGWELIHSFVICLIFNTGTFNPFNWVANIIVAAAASAALEWLVIRFLFKTKIGRKGFGFLALANVVSTALAFVLVLIDPPRF
jgi:hypothetical protein